MKESLQKKLFTLAQRYEEISRQLSDPEVIREQNRFRELSKEYAQLEPLVKCFHDYERNQTDYAAAHELLNFPEFRRVAEEEIAALNEQKGVLEERLKTLLIPKDPNDERNVFLEVRAGTGGNEAALFAGDLFRMYSRFAETMGWKVTIVSEHAGEQGGFKEIIARIEGQGVYSQLKFESGTHRVQRVPATEAQGRIHTSACTVAIMPEAEELEAVKINLAECRIDTFRASGAGGQHVNKTDSAIRLTHLPTGIVVQCQSDRSQHKNRSSAMKQLKAKLYEMEEQKKKASLQALEEGKSAISWGSQIRSYVLDDARVKDLRTGVETTNTQAVLDGDLDRFIEASLKEGV